MTKSSPLCWKGELFTLDPEGDVGFGFGLTHDHSEASAIGDEYPDDFQRFVVHDEVDPSFMARRRERALDDDVCPTCRNQYGVCGAVKPTGEKPRMVLAMADTVTVMSDMVLLLTQLRYTTKLRPVSSFLSIDSTQRSPQ